MYRLVRNIRGIDRVAFKRDLKVELNSLANHSADQYNATLRSVLDIHSPAAKRKGLTECHRLCSVCQRGASTGKKVLSSVEGIWSRRS